MKLTWTVFVLWLAATMAAAPMSPERGPRPQKPKKVSVSMATGR